MTTNKTNLWFFWILLIAGLAFLGACSNNGPTSPDPSDVQEFIFEGGDDLSKEDISELTDEFEALQAVGGGVNTIVTTDPYTMVGVFDRLSGDALAAGVIIQQDGLEPLIYDIEGEALFNDLTYPITVTVWSELYVAQSVVETTANVLAFGMEKLAMDKEFCMVIGYSFDMGMEENIPWLTRAKSTHLDRAWNTTEDRVGYSTPNAYAYANPYQPVGAVAFIYELGEVPIITDGTPIEQLYDLVGYSYAHIGILDPWSVGGWILNLIETGTGTSYTPGNFTLDYIPDTPTVPKLGDLAFTPGGCVDDNLEFIPYYPPYYVDLDETGGSYEINAFDPPTVIDRDIIIAEAVYRDGASETRYFPWDHTGAGVPDFALSVPPVYTDVDLINLLGKLFLTATWTNDQAEGFQVISLRDTGGYLYWEIRLADTATSLPVVGVMFPPGPSHTQYMQNSTVSRIECTGIDINGFDYTSLWTGTTAEVNSIPATSPWTDSGLNM